MNVRYRRKRGDSWRPDDGLGDDDDGQLEVGIFIFTSRRYCSGYKAIEITVSIEAAKQNFAYCAAMVFDGQTIT